jgi:hypothetical protein
MNSRSDQISTSYFNSRWFPTVIFLANLAVLCMVKASRWRALFLVRVLAFCLLISYLGILSASICNFIKKRWTKAVVNLVMLPVCAILFYSVCLFLAALKGADI